MNTEKTKVYVYTRVSTSMQVDGYSLDAQKNRIQAYAKYNNYEIVGEYEDAGKSGKTTKDRVAFNQMLKDIQNKKDSVSFVLVFKLSRFGRNAADVLNSLQLMQDYGVNLICVEDSIDSSKGAGKLIISVLSAVAEIERENIRIQTMEGRIQKAREGKWNGGRAPYGYKLENGILHINEEEAKTIKIIFEKYTSTDLGANGIAKFLINNGTKKIIRNQNDNAYFDAIFIRRVLKNPVYCGKIAYGRRKTEKIHGTRNEYKLVEQKDFLIVDGLHEKIVSEEIWQKAQEKLHNQTEKFNISQSEDNKKVHLLSGILKCPICGAGMSGNKNSKAKPNGLKYKDFFYYSCKHYTKLHGKKCDFKNQINELTFENEVIETIQKLVHNRNIISRIKKLAIETEGQPNNQIYKILSKFKKTYGKLSEKEKRNFLSTLISNIYIHKEKHHTGYWLESILFSVPIIPKNMKVTLFKDENTKYVVKLCIKNP